MGKRAAEPVRHHTVPEFLSKRFADSDGMLHAARARVSNRHVFPVSPSNLFVERYWHTQVLPDGTKDASVEHSLARQLESPTSVVLRKILDAAESDDLPRLSGEERHTWDSFFVSQRIRTRDHHHASGLYEDFRERLDRLLSQYARRGRIIPSDIARRIRSPENVERLKNNVRIQSYVRPLPEAMNVLAARGIAVIKALGDSERFLIGSYPVVKLCPPETNDLRDPRVEMWLPISSSVAVGTWGAAGTETIAGRIDSGFASNINDAVARQSSIIAGCCPSLVSLVLRRGLVRSTYAASL